MDAQKTVLQEEVVTVLFDSRTKRPFAILRKCFEGDGEPRLYTLKPSTYSSLLRVLNLLITSAKACVHAGEKLEISGAPEVGIMSFDIVNKELSPKAPRDIHPLSPTRLH